MAHKVKGWCNNHPNWHNASDGDLPMVGMIVLYLSSEQTHTDAEIWEITDVYQNGDYMPLEEFPNYGY